MSSQIIIIIQNYVCWVCVCILSFICFTSYKMTGLLAKIGFWQISHISFIAVNYWHYIINLECSVFHLCGSLQMAKIYPLLDKYRLTEFYKKFLELGVKDEKDFIDSIDGDTLTRIGEISFPCFWHLCIKFWYLSVILL